MLTLKTKTTYVALALVIGALLILAPIVPSSVVFAWSSPSKGDSRNQSSLDASEIDAVLRVVKAHEMYGFDDGEPASVSVYDLLSGRQRLGILSIRDALATDSTVCPECVVVVATGLECGGFCGGGTTFFLIRSAGQWEVRRSVQWVS